MEDFTFSPLESQYNFVDTSGSYLQYLTYPRSHYISHHPLCSMPRKTEGKCALSVQSHTMKVREKLCSVQEKNVKYDVCLNVSLVDCKLVAVFHSQQSDGEHSKGYIIINIFLRLRRLYVKIPLRQSITIG